MLLMDKNKDRFVQEEEFVQHMMLAAEGTTDIHINQQVVDVLTERASGQFHYDFSASFCGSRGAKPVVAALGLDKTFESVDFSGCGLHTDAILELTKLATSHTVRYLSACAFRRLSVLLNATPTNRPHPPQDSGKRVFQPFSE